jgi:D-tyrosyl-tRNA(Tyr) deacylase
MRAVLQRVQSGSVTIGDDVIGSISRGLVILLGIKRGDTEKDALYLAENCVNLRIFSVADGKFNLSAIDVVAEFLIISQFTLYADCRKGKRPNFIEAAPPEQSEPLYDSFISRIRKSGLKVESGKFGGNMCVTIVNDGPVTVLLESKT